MSVLDVIAVPPGSTIREMLDQKGITVYEFAIDMDLSRDDALDLLAGKKEINRVLAEKLCALLGPPVQFWMRLEMLYREKIQDVK